MQRECSSRYGPVGMSSGSLHPTSERIRNEIAQFSEPCAAPCHVILARPRQVDPDVRSNAGPPGTKHHDTIAEVDCFIKAMRDEHNGRPYRLPNLQQLVLQIFPRLQVDRGEWFVHQQHPRIFGEGARKSNALLHASRKLGGISDARIRTGRAAQFRAAQSLAASFCSRREFRGRIQRCRGPCAKETVRNSERPWTARNLGPKPERHQSVPRLNRRGSSRPTISTMSSFRIRFDLKRKRILPPQPSSQNFLVLDGRRSSVPTAGLPIERSWLACSGSCVPQQLTCPTASIERKPAQFLCHSTESCAPSDPMNIHIARPFMRCTTIAGLVPEAPSHH